ncbi:phosphate acyltransferase [Yoonia sp. MH D7]
MTSPFVSSKTAIVPQNLLDMAHHFGGPRVAIACAGGPLPMQAAKEATALDLMTPVFVGKPDLIRKEAAALNWDISAYPLHTAMTEEDAGLIAATLCGAGDADVLMKGDIKTHHFLAGALARDAGLRTEERLIHIFHISPAEGGKPILISDAAVNIRPNINVRKIAMRRVADLLQILGTNRPKIAILSGTETPTEAFPSSMEARELADWAKTHMPDADVSGPLALDLILSSASAATKGMTNDPVAGFADAIIVPDVISGNALFKAFVYLSGGCAAGIVSGAKVPILLTSRADPIAARIASIAIANITCGLPK